MISPTPTGYAGDSLPVLMRQTVETPKTWKEIELWRNCMK